VNVDLEQTMLFIVEQQAKFETDIGEMKAILNRHMEAIGSLVEVSRLQSERVDRLEQGMVTMVEAHNRLARAQEDLAQTQKGTERRLNDFIAQVSRYLAGGNGRGRGPGAPGKK
jgi:hypothetical protein